MSPALARIKRGVRRGIELCSGIDGAAATAERSRSVAGDWNNLNARVFPPIDCALALDEVALAQGRMPPIAVAYARELGGVFVPLPDCSADPETLAGMVMQLSGRLGDLSREMATALADGTVTAVEARRLVDVQAELDATSAQLRQALTAMADGGC